MTSPSSFCRKFIFLTLLLNLLAPFSSSLAFDWDALEPVAPNKSLSRSERQLKTLRSTIATRLGDLEIEVHYPQYVDSWSAQVEAILREVAPLMVEKFDWLPKGTLHLVLRPESLVANGDARAFPRNQIGLNLHPPVGNEHLKINPRFMRALVIHEFAHVMHMDQTRGLSSTVRSIFGALGKWNGLTPKWFSEGFAVWAETYYTDGGRLKSQQIEYELRSALKNEDFCRRLDCLDDPGVYPYGRLAYWMGAYFMNSLEEEKEGTLACLLKENSRSLPFFLNDAFIACTGNGAEFLFSRFLSKFESSEKSRTPSKVESELIPFEGSPLIERGGILLGRHFYILEYKRPVAKLVERDILKNQVTKRWRFKRPITSLQAPTPFHQKRGRFIFSSSDDPSEGRSDWWELETKSFQVEKIEFPHPASYLYRLDQNLYMGLGFIKGAWELRFWDQSKKNRERSKRRWRFEFGQDLQNPLVSEWNQRPVLFYQLNYLTENEEGEQESVYTLQKIDLLNSTPPQEVFSSPKPWSLIEARDDVLLIKQNDQILSFGSRDIGLPPDFASDVVGLWYTQATKNKGVAVFNTLSSPGELFRGVLPTRKSRKALVQKNSLVKSAAPLKEAKTAKRVDYFGLRYLSPHYWTVGLGGNEYLTRYDVATSLNDPLNRHNLSLSGSYYQEIARSGGSVSYTYAPQIFSTTVDYGKFYQVRGAARSFDVSEGMGVQVFKGFGSRRFNYQVTGFARQESIVDFISARETNRFGIAQAISYSGIFSDDFLQGSSLSAQHSRQETKGFESFLAQSYQFQSDFRLAQRLDFSLQGAISEYKKNDLRSGVLYGGGSEALFNLGGLHEFYGIEYGDAIGNEIRSAKAEFSFELSRPYSGGSFFPFFLKSTNLLLGSDYIKTSNIFLKDRFIEKEELFSFYTGVSFKANAFYAVPVSLDLIFAQVPNEEVGDQSSLLFLLRGDFFP